jgi:acyl carrier protein
MTERNVVRQTLAELLETDTGEKYEDLKDETSLREGLGLDSVDVVSIVSQIERRFRIRMTHEELATLSTVGDLLDLMETKLASLPPESNAA